jgi:hypothetical protein
MRVRVIIVAFKNNNYNNSECVLVALVVQHAMYMRRIFIACPALPYFSTLSHKRHDFRENVIGYKMRILTFSTTFV